MSAFIAFIKISFKASFAYRSSTFMGLIGAIFSVLVQITIWSYIFRNDVSMTKYMTAYAILSQFLIQVFHNVITTDVVNKISTGAFSTDLIKPTNLILVYWSTGLGKTLAEVITRGVPLLIILSPILIEVIHPNGLKMLIFVCICLAAYVLASLIYILTGFFAFIITEAGWFPRILKDTINFFSGAIIPLAFFPAWLLFITKLLPFQLMLSFPIRFLLEDLPQSEIILNLTLLGFWLIFFLFLTQLFYQRAIKHSIVQGG